MSSANWYTPPIPDFSNAASSLRLPPPQAYPQFLVCMLSTFISQSILPSISWWIGRSFIRGAAGFHFGYVRIRSLSFLPTKLRSSRRASRIIAALLAISVITRDSSFITHIFAAIWKDTLTRHPPYWAAAVGS